jgi:hypothetical protein
MDDPTDFSWIEDLDPSAFHVFIEAHPFAFMTDDLRALPRRPPRRGFEFL